jgi:hypothetical protein
MKLEVFVLGFTKNGEGATTTFINVAFANVCNKQNKPSIL